MVHRNARQPVVIAICLALVVGPALGVKFSQAALVHRHRISEHREDDVVLSKLIIFGKFDGADQVADAGNSQPFEFFKNLLAHAILSQDYLASSFIEKPDEANRELVVNANG